MTTTAEASRKIRAALKAAFPNTKFTVALSSGRCITWTDTGPSISEAENALLAAGCGEAEIAWNGTRYIKVAGDTLCFDRFNAAQRAAEVQEREQRHQDWLAQAAQRRREAEEARAAAIAAVTLPSAFWSLESIPAIPLLRQLNDWVIQQNEKRLPKWKFKFGADLAAQIQTKITRKHVILFECVAIRTENVSARHFIEPKRLRGSTYWQLRFDLFCDDHEQSAAWQFKARSAMRGRDCPRDGTIELRQQIIAALRPDRFAYLSSDRMLSPACICCGKSLTDPASMARWIGPECFGNGSVNIPWVFKAEAA